MSRRPTPRRRRNPLPRWVWLAIAGGATAVVGVGALAVMSSRLRERIRFRWPRRELPSVLDLVDYDEGDVGPEPEGLEYDEGPPCELPPQPWEPQPEVLTPDQPVAVGLEGDPGAVGLEGDPAGFCTPDADLEPVQKTEVPFAEGGPRPTWPLDTSSNNRLKLPYIDVRGKWHGRSGRSFGATRYKTIAGKRTPVRTHAGVDLNADVGDIVYAPEGGEVLAAMPFYRGLGAVYLLTDSGVIVNLGEVEYGSWRRFGIPTGIGKGTRVEQGDPVARVGLSVEPDGKAGSHMLHLETYEPFVTIDDIRQKKMAWTLGQPPPDGLLDPTRWLVRARKAAYDDRLAAEMERT